MQMLSRRRWSSSDTARMLLSRGNSYMSQSTDQIVAPPPPRTQLLQRRRRSPEIFPPPPDLTFSQKLSSFPPETPEDDHHLPKSAIYTVQHHGSDKIGYTIEAVPVNPMNPMDPISEVGPTIVLVRIPYGYPKAAGFVAFGSKIFMIGGHIEHKPFRSVYVYDVNELSFHQAPDMNGAKVYPQFGCINGLIYVLDGNLNNRESENVMFESLDPVSMTWTKLPSPPFLNTGDILKGLFVCGSKIVITTREYTYQYSTRRRTWMLMNNPATHKDLFHCKFHLIDGKLGFVRANGNSLRAFDFNLSNKNMVKFRELFVFGESPFYKFEESPFFEYWSTHYYAPFGNQMFAFIRTGFHDDPYEYCPQAYQLVDIFRYANFEKGSILPPTLTTMHSSVHTLPPSSSFISLRECFPMYEETKATVPNSVNMGVEENGRKRSAKREKKNGDKRTQINS